MIRGFWVPTDWKRGAMVLAIVALIVLRQSELVGLMDSTSLVFGWLPAQLAYSILIGVAATIIAIVMYFEAPDPPAEFDPTVDERPEDDTMGGEN